MRHVAALLVVAVLAGCGGSAERAGGLGADAAELVPRDAIAFISVDARFDSEQWQVIEELGFSPVKLVLGRFDFERDVQPALGDEIDFALLGDEGIALTQPEDQSKLRQLVDGVEEDDEPLVVERVGEWSVVAESQAALEAVRRVHPGRSLADEKQFRTAIERVEGDTIATAYATGAALRKLPPELRALIGEPAWVAAGITTDDDAVRLRAHIPSSGLTPYGPRLLREVPSGAVLAASFKDFEFLPRGEGVLYVVPSTLIPIVVLTLETPTPRAAARALERTAARVRAETGGALAMHVVTLGNRVTLTNGLGPVPATGGRLVDDAPFKEALAAADVPEEVTWLAYADTQRLMPLVRALSPELPKLDRVGTLVAFGTRSGLEARLTRR
jgi:hypothetical protein